MRKAFSNQLRLDCQSIEELSLNLNCRDQIIPLLAGLKYAYKHDGLRTEMIRLVAADINKESRTDTGRVGFDYWQIIVLAVIRLGCNVDYDRLQDLCENHFSLRCILGVGQWEGTSFAARRIRDTLALIQPDTIASLNRLLVSHCHQLDENAATKVRADSFVVETNIHYPTESRLIWDGMRKIIPLCQAIASSIQAVGWRQAEHLQKKAKALAREIARISASKSPHVKKGLNPAYAELITHARMILERAEKLKMAGETCANGAIELIAQCEELAGWIKLTLQVCDTAYRRTQLGERVPNTEKLFSLFETHTQLYRRGKAGQPAQFGRLVLVYEDRIGFISHYYLMGRTETDSDTVCAQTRQAQETHGNRIAECSFDRGFFSKENEQELKKIVANPCLPATHRNQYSAQMKTATVEFHAARQRHPGIESAIGALQSGNGLKRCRDKSEKGFERYLGFAILGRNFHVLGKLLIARKDTESIAGKSKRKAA